MQILMITQYFPPEVGAAQNRLFHLAQALGDCGHQVTILTACPNYPRGEIDAAYRGRWIVEEQQNGMRVIRTWLYTRPNMRFIGRLVSYLSYALLAVLFQVRTGRQDVVLAESPPLFAGLAGYVISRSKRARFVLNVSDLWADSAIDLGVVKSPILIRAARALERFLYRRAVFITGQTQGIVEQIGRIVPGKRVQLITNGVDGGRIEQAACLSAQARVRGDGRPFVVGYAGLHGLMQDLDAVLEAACLLQGDENIIFSFYGDGPRKQSLVRLAHERQLRNVLFEPPQPVARMPAIFASFDLMVIPLRRLAILKGAVPCKMLEAMGAGLPILLAGQGEAERLVRNAGAGIVVEPERPEALAEAIRLLHRDEPYRLRLGENAQAYVFEHYDRRRINAKFEKLLVDLCGCTPSSCKEFVHP